MNNILNDESLFKIKLIKCLNHLLKERTEGQQQLQVFLDGYYSRIFIRPV